MNDQPTENTELERAQLEIAPPRNMPRERLMAGAQVRGIVPRSFEEVWRIAQLSVKAGLVPRDLANVERAAVAIMHGLELGLPPMMALQRIAVINGRPSVWGDGVPAIALATGELHEWDEQLIEDHKDGLTAVCRVSRRHGRGQILTKEAKFSVADAKAADLWDERKRVKRKRKDGSEYETDNDSPWHLYPKRMLQMRARVAFRDLFADAMCGLYIAEELVGRDADREMRDVTPYQPIANPLGGSDETRAAAGPAARDMPDATSPGGEVTAGSTSLPSRPTEAAGEPKEEGATATGQTPNSSPAASLPVENGRRRNDRKAGAP